MVRNCIVFVNTQSPTHNLIELQQKQIYIMVILLHYFLHCNLTDDSLKRYK